jgi:tRNA G18 (ribose-2'-O)-methylase SpoU
VIRKLKMDELGRLSPEDFRDAARIPVMLILENIRSASNVGSIFRTADSFAIEGICLCGITAQPPHREILKTALGATETVNWGYYENTQDCLEKLRKEGWYIAALEQTTASSDMAAFHPESGQKVALVLGNEVSGVSESALKTSHKILEISQFGTKHSLNVSVCAGIALFHFSTQYRNRRN